MTSDAGEHEVPPHARERWQKKADKLEEEMASNEEPWSKEWWDAYNEWLKIQEILERIDEDSK